MLAEDVNVSEPVPARILSFEGLHGMVTLVLFSGHQATFKEPVRHCFRDEAKEVATKCKAAGPEKPEVYSPEYIEDFFGPRTTQMVADRSPQ